RLRTSAGRVSAASCSGSSRGTRRTASWCRRSRTHCGSHVRARRAPGPHPPRAAIGARDLREQALDARPPPEDLLRDGVVDQFLEHGAVRLDAVRERVAADEVGEARVLRLELAAAHIEVLRTLEGVEHGGAEIGVRREEFVLYAEQ